MKLRTYKSKKDNLFYFQFKSKHLGRIFLKNPIGFESKIERNDFLISVIDSLSDNKLSNLKKLKNDTSILILKNKFGKTLIRSKRFNKKDLNSILKEIEKELPEIKKIAWQKPHSNFLKEDLQQTRNSANSNKNEILKKDKKPKAEKQYLKKGNYHFNDIYYDIFLSGNGRHYFSFVNKAGKTVLLNGNIKGFDSVEEAEKVIEQVLSFARERKNFEIKTAKDGKFFFNLYNDKSEKIAKSFFFRKKDALQDSINEFLGNTSLGSAKNESSEGIKEKAAVAPIIAAPIQSAKKVEVDEKKKLSINAAAEERRRAAERERLALEKKRKEEQAAKERQRKEAAIAMAAKNEKAEKNKQGTGEKTAVVKSTPRDPYYEKDLFDGCFKWLGFLLLLGLLLFIFAYFFKGCDNIGNPFSDNTEISDTNNTGTDTSTLDSLSIEQGANNLNDSQSDDSDSSGVDNGGSGNGGNNSNGNSYQGNENSSTSGNDLKGNCNCGDKAVVFEIPNTEAKSVNRLGTNPQFGNTHGLSASDFLEELRHASSINSWDKKYLDYLYKAMGYKNGFADARVSQISQAKINPGVKGILGFGKYSGYGYSKLDLTGQDLEVFHIQAANGCHLNFMKTCGNLLFICE